MNRSVRPVRVFLSYSRKDEPLVKGLRHHLRYLEDAKHVSIFQDRTMLAGERLHERIANELRAADVVLYFLSSNFNGSDYCNDEMKLGLDLHASRRTILVPVILRPIAWESGPLGAFKALPEVPFDKHGTKDAALKDVADGVRRLVSKINPSIQTAPSKPAKKPKQGKATPPGGHAAVGSRDSLRARLRERCVGTFLQPFFASHPDWRSVDQVPVDALRAYSRFFLTIATREKSPLGGANVFDQLSEFVIASKDSMPLEISGLPGSGKSTFLALLYVQLTRATRRATSTVTPVFIDLNRYEHVVYDDGDGDTEQAAVRLFREELGELEVLLKSYPDEEIVVLLDGVANHARFRDSILRELHAVLGSARHKKLVSLRYERTTDPISDDAPPGWAPGDRIILSRLNVSDSRVTEFAEAAMALYGFARKVSGKELMHAIKQLNVEFIDLFTVTRLASALSKPTGELSRFSDLLFAHCRTRLAQNPVTAAQPDVALAHASRLAFNRAYLGTNYSAGEIRGRPEWELVHEHPTIQDFLIANHVVNTLKEFGQKAGSPRESRVPIEFTFVYPYQINRFAKELINRTQTNQHQVALAFERLTALENNSVDLLEAKTHICYLAGRLSDQQAKARAISALKSLKQTLAPQLDQQSSGEAFAKKLHLLARTVYISLIYLNERSASSEYIDLLLRDADHERVNRGFHLEYYGDTDSAPTEALTHADSLGPCEHTFEQLRARVCRGPASSPLFEVEVFTLASLAQHRHAAKKLSPTMRQRFIETLLEVKAFRKDMTPAVRNHASMVLDHLQLDDFSVITAATELYRLKTTKRKGWVVRGIANPESVAEHSFAAALLALLYLPEKLSADEAEQCGAGSYDKRTIVHMLLVHDLAEAYIGDLLPGEKDDSKRRQEEQAFEYLGMLGTYTDIADTRGTLRSFQEFEGKATVNARIAKDIDKLENLLQLYLYADKLEQREFERFRDGLIDGLVTPPGRKIMKLIREHFEARG
jgi:5'-deoxynucleotidase YfbR-like HD superfamily hydrolase